MTETPKPRWSRGLAAGKIPFPVLSPLATANSTDAGQPSNSSSWKLTVSPSTPAAVPTPPPLAVLTAVKPGKSPLWPSLRQGAKEAQQAKGTACSTAQPLVLPSVPSDAPGTSSKGAGLRNRLPVQRDADDAKAGDPSTSALPSAEHSPGFSFQPALPDSARPGVGRFSLASSASKVPPRFRANPLFSCGSPAAARSPAPPTPPDSLANPPVMRTPDKAASRLSGTSAMPSLATAERQPKTASEEIRFRLAAESVPASSSGSSPSDQQSRRHEQEMGAEPPSLTPSSQEHSSSAPQLQPLPPLQKQPPRGSRQPEWGGPRNDSLSNKEANADRGEGVSWKVPLMVARPGGLPGSARRRRSGRPAAALAGAIKEAAAAEAREQSPPPPPAFVPQQQHPLKPGETAAAETVAGLQRKLQDLGIPLTQTLPEMPRRAAADAAPAEKTASELGAAVQQLRELQAQARALLEEAVEREDDGDDTIEHLILGPERPAPVVLSSQKARLAPNLRAGDKQSLLGQNLDKLQTLLALQEQGNKFAALLL